MAYKTNLLETKAGDVPYLVFYDELISPAYADAVRQKMKQAPTSL